MKLLKKIPIRYRGELHDVRLINFTVDMDEIRGKVPSTLKPRNFTGRAMISMVDVKLRKMHPTFMPPVLTFNYRHIAFRLLVEDAAYNNGENKGIYFFKSFTDKPWIIAGGKLLTDYNLEQAAIREADGSVSLNQGKQLIKYCVAGPIAGNPELKTIIGGLDRAYSVMGEDLRVTRIQRERWPIQAVECSGFENTFFKTARLEGAFRVFETIYYDWLPPKAVKR